MNDLTGLVVTTIRDNPAVAVVTTRVRGGELAPGDVAPAIVVIPLSNTRSPFGPGHSRVGLQAPRFGVNCYATSYIQAAQLAGLVSDSLHLMPPKTSSGRVIRQALDDGWGGPILDPRTNWITETVIVQVVGHA